MCDVIADIVQSPSPNWFLPNAVSGRESDNLLVTATFKNIVVYRVANENRLPKVLKLIPHEAKLGEHVSIVRLNSNAADIYYGQCVATASNKGSVRWYDLNTGELKGHHLGHNAVAVMGITWGHVCGEEVVVTVGEGGKINVWQPRHNVLKTSCLTGFNHLGLVETVPGESDQVVVVADKVLLLVQLRDGSILRQIRGHDFPIYDFAWFNGTGNPFISMTVNSRAEALKDTKNDGKDKTSSGFAYNKNAIFFATSDHGRNIFLWDLTASKYVTRVNVPQSLTESKSKWNNKQKTGGGQHMALAWWKGQLFSTTVRGDLLSWTLQLKGSKFKPVFQLHSRPVFNIVVLGNLSVTCGQDRFIQGFDLELGKKVFEAPTLGGSATTLAFCPHDSNRLAIGSQDNSIRILNFGSSIPVYTSTAMYGISGKILSLAWHPTWEGRLAFGTSEGQVALLDIGITCKVLAFSCYHQRQRNVYKVEWAPGVCPEKSGLKEKTYVYSLGDKEIVIRNPSDSMGDPVKLQSFLKEKELWPKTVCEFSFTHDYKFLAVGGSDGQIFVYRSCDLNLSAKVSVIHKTIQHLLWKPVNAKIQESYVLAVASGENNIHLLAMDLNGDEVDSQPLTVTQATRELCGHSSRVVWLAWSPHTAGVLASASYDHTIQLWDSNTGVPLCNYGGHCYRVFRVEFHPTDADLMLSCAEDNCVHAWRPSQVKTRTHGETSACLKEFKRKLRPDCLEDTFDGGLMEGDSAPRTATSEVTGKKLEKISASGTSIKAKTYKSFFPNLHSVSGKKNCLNLALFSLINVKKCDKEATMQHNPLEGNEDMAVSASTSGDMVKNCIEKTLQQYNSLTEKVIPPSVEDIAFALDLYGSSDRVDALLGREITCHETNGNWHQAALMHNWRGTLDDHIQSAIRHKRLTADLVASAPQISHKLWQEASEAYSVQLQDERNFFLAADYLVNIGKVEAAVELLIKNNFHREAYVLSQSRCCFNEEVTTATLNKWVANLIYEGRFDIASMLMVSVGRHTEAARLIARRNTATSFMASAMLHQMEGNIEMQKAMFMKSLTEAVIKEETTLVQDLLQTMPDLKWVEIVVKCHSAIMSFDCVSHDLDMNVHHNDVVTSSPSEVVVAECSQISMTEKNGIEGAAIESSVTAVSKDEGFINGHNVAEGAMTEVNVIEEFDHEKSVNEDIVIEGSVNEDNAIEGSVNEDNAIEGSVNEDNAIEGSVSEDNVVEGSVNEDNVIEGSVNEDNVVEGSVNEDNVIEGSVNEDNVIEGSVNEDYVIEEYVNEDIVIEGSVIENTLVNGSVLLEEITSTWASMGYSRDDYPHLYNCITEAFTTQLLPTSVKQLWWFVSVGLTEALLSDLSFEKHLMEIMLNVLSWNKMDQLMRLMQILLPNGFTSRGSACFHPLLNVTTDSALHRLLRHCDALTHIWMMKEKNKSDLSCNELQRLVNLLEPNVEELCSQLDLPGQELLGSAKVMVPQICSVNDWKEVEIINSLI